MAWPKGKEKPKTGGRKKGTPNKRTVEFLKILEETNFCPTRAQIRIYRRAAKAYDGFTDKAFKALEEAETSEEKLAALGLLAKLSEHAPTYLAIAQRSSAELMQYAQPKRKSIEIKPPSDGDEEAGGVLIFLPPNGRERKAS
jgi:hypothetical protein